MEVGKYYIDGEGFYLCEHTDEKFSRFKAVTLICGRVSSCNPQYVTEACDRRFVECPKEVFDKAEAMCDEFFKKLNDFNTQEFMPRWNAEWNNVYYTITNNDGMDIECVSSENLRLCKEENMEGKLTASNDVMRLNIAHQK